MRTDWTRQELLVKRFDIQKELYFCFLRTLSKFWLLGRAFIHHFSRRVALFECHPLITTVVFSPGTSASQAATTLLLGGLFVLVFGSVNWEFDCHDYRRRRRTSFLPSDSTRVASKCVMKISTACLGAVAVTVALNPFLFFRCYQRHKRVYIQPGVHKDS